MDMQVDFSSHMDKEEDKLEPSFGVTVVAPPQSGQDPGHRGTKNCT